MAWTAQADSRGKVWTSKHSFLRYIPINTHMVRRFVLFQCVYDYLSWWNYVKRLPIFGGIVLLAQWHIAGSFSSYGWLRFGLPRKDVTYVSSSLVWNLLCHRWKTGHDSWHNPLPRPDVYIYFSTNKLGIFYQDEMRRGKLCPLFSQLLHFLGMRYKTLGISKFASVGTGNFLFIYIRFSALYIH